MINQFNKQLALFAILTYSILAKEAPNQQKSVVHHINDNNFEELLEKNSQQLLVEINSEHDANETSLFLNMEQEKIDKLSSMVSIGVVNVSKSDNLSQKQGEVHSYNGNRSSFDDVLMWLLKNGFIPVSKVISEIDDLIYTKYIQPHEQINAQDKLKEIKESKKQSKSQQDDTVNYRQINEDYEDDKLTAYMFGKAVKFYENGIKEEHKNIYEKDLDLSKSGIIKIFERISSNEDEDIGDWEAVEENDLFSIEYRIYGSYITQDFFGLKLKAYIDSSEYSIPQLIRAMSNTDVRQVWDVKDTTCLKIHEIVDDTVMIVYQRSPSSVSVVSDRDFLEKKVIIREKDTYYVFMSSVPDEIKESEGDSPAVRALTLTGFQTYKQLEDGRILYESVVQTDLNMGSRMMSNIAQAASMSALPGRMKQWFPRFLEAAKSQSRLEDFNYIPE
ncbi:UNKNOWN [Stylonychia lemnae]|uniref:START domain-containing protein n=1 Tax=Stylonychia lemnae TaxID=5949 RepID=A0A078B4I8_STYLE|nr:UNKNOWN [Stylonychia lemnae]|eukprot:CDW89440.1 UNKNOWN [Stylonychia lemnae]